MGKNFRIFGVLMLLLPHWPGDAYTQQKERVKNAAQAEKKSEQAEKFRKKAYQHIRKETIKRRRKMQTPETRLRMREADKRADRINSLDEERLVERLFKKRPPRKRIRH